MGERGTFRKKMKLGCHAKERLNKLKKHIEEVKEQERIKEEYNKKNGFTNASLKRCPYCKHLYVSVGKRCPKCKRKNEE